MSSNALQSPYGYLHCMNISITRLRHIVAVARTGSFSLAAEQEGISQPALSRSIQAFEAEYGLRAFDRSRAGVTLTPAGAEALQHAQNVLAAAGEMHRKMALIGKGEAGRVGIGFGPLIASIILPGLGSRLLRSHPHAQLVSIIRPVDQLVQALSDGKIEAIIGNSEQLSQISGASHQHIGNLELAMYVRKGHPLDHDRTLTMHDLAIFPVASGVEGPTGIAPGFAGGMVCENYHVLRDVVLNTDCVWLTSPSLLISDDERERLSKLSVNDLLLSQTAIWVAYRPDRSRSPLLSLTIDICAQLLEPKPVHLRKPPEV